METIYSVRGEWFFCFLFTTRRKSRTISRVVLFHAYTYKTFRTTGGTIACTHSRSHIIHAYQIVFNGNVFIRDRLVISYTFLFLYLLFFFYICFYYRQFCSVSVPFFLRYFPFLPIMFDALSLCMVFDMTSQIFNKF